MTATTERTSHDVLQTQGAELTVAKGKFLLPDQSAEVPDWIHTSHLVSRFRRRKNKNRRENLSKRLTINKAL